MYHAFDRFLHQRHEYPFIPCAPSSVKSRFFLLYHCNSTYAQATMIPPRGFAKLPAGFAASLASRLLSADSLAIKSYRRILSLYIAYSQTTMIKEPREREGLRGL